MCGEHRLQPHSRQHRLRLSPVNIPHQLLHHHAQRPIPTADLGALLPRAVHLLSHIGQLEINGERPSKLPSRANIQSR